MNRRMLTWCVLLAVPWAGVLPLRGFGATPESGSGEDEASRAYNSAVGLLNRGLYDLAVVEYRKFLSGHSAHEKVSVARYGLAVSLFRLDRLDEAVAELSVLRGVSKFTYAAEVATMFGQCKLARKEYAAAAEAFDVVARDFADHALADDAAAGAIESIYAAGKPAELVERCKAFTNRWSESPSKVRVLYLWGLSAMSLGDYDAAGEKFGLVLSLQPEATFAGQTKLMLGQCLYRQGHTDKAQEVLARVGTVEKFLQDDLAYWTAKCLLQKNDFLGAARLLKDAAERYPESELAAAISYDCGYALLQSGDADGAAMELKGFLAKYSKEDLAPNALHLAAVAEHQKHDYDGSKGHCASFLRQYVTHRLAPAMKFLAAENDFLSQRWAEAVAGFRGFLGDHPSDPQALMAKFRLGLALHRLDRPDEAAEPLKAAAEAAHDQPSFRTAVLLLGDIGFHRGEWKAAEEYFSQYLAFGAGNHSVDDVILKLGLCKERQERYEEAIGYFDRLENEPADSPQRLQARFEKAQCLAALGKDQEAERIFRLAATQEGDNRLAPFAENHLGLIALKRKAFQDAVLHFERAISLAPGTAIEADARFQLGQALMAEGRFAEAEAVFDRFVRQLPGDARALAARAQRAIALSRRDRCDESLAAIDLLQGQSPGLDRSLSDALQYEKAWCLRKLDRPEAAEAFRALLGEGSDPTLRNNALLELAEMEAAAKQYAAAARNLEQLLDSAEARPDSASSDVREQGLYRLAVAKFQLERFDEAAELFERFLERFSSSSLTASAAWFCGEAWAKLGRPDRAVSHLSRVTQDFPADSAHGPALLRLGESAAALQRWSQSEAALTLYLDRYGESESWYQAQFGVGWARENQGRFDEAISAYLVVVDRHKGPTSARAQFQIGECMFAKNQYQDAVAEFLKVDILYAYPEWSAAGLYEAGRCFEKLSKHTEAHAQFQAVVDRYGQTKWAAMARERLSINSDNSQATR